MADYALKTNTNCIHTLATESPGTTGSFGSKRFPSLPEESARKLNDSLLLGSFDSDA